MVASDEKEIIDSMKRIQDMDGPVLLEIKVRIDSRDNLGRPTTSPKENKEHFMNYLK